MSTDIVAPDAGGVVEILDRVAGELVDIKTAQATRLAELVDSLKTMQQTLADEIAMVSSEFVRRMDRAGEYTLHVTTPDRRRQWTVTAPSKTVGTSRVDPGLLRAELLELATADDGEEPAIDADLARAALRRRVSIETTVNVTADLDALVSTLEQGLHEIAGVPVYDVKVRTSEDVVVAGVNRLERAGHAGAVARATVPVVPPPRRASVKLKSAAAERRKQAS